MTVQYFTGQHSLTTFLVWVLSMTCSYTSDGIQDLALLI